MNESEDTTRTLCHGCVATSTETHPLGWDVKQTGVRNPVMAWFCPECVRAGGLRNRVIASDLRRVAREREGR